ncbi:hypothetical protein Hanom_Chr09g00816661 [Helianthus anomalus]
MIYYINGPCSQSRGGLQTKPRWAGAPPGKKISAKFRRESRPHPLEFFVRTPWNFCLHQLSLSSLHASDQNISDNSEQSAAAYHRNQPPYHRRSNTGKFLCYF